MTAMTLLKNLKSKMFFGETVKLTCKPFNNVKIFKFLIYVSKTSNYGKMSYSMCNRARVSVEVVPVDAPVINLKLP